MTTVWSKWVENNNRSSVFNWYLELRLLFIYNTSCIWFCIRFKSHFKIPLWKSLYNLCSSDLFKHHGNLKTMTRTLKSKEFAPIYEIDMLLRSVCISNVSFAILVLLGTITKNWNSFPDVSTILKEALEGMVKLLLLFLLIYDSSERGDSDDKLYEWSVCKTFEILRDGRLCTIVARYWWNHTTY